MIKDNSYYYTYDYPVPYKSLLIYPATMKEYNEFNTYVSCLLLDKNSVPDVDVISMSYLQYIYYISKENEDMSLYLLKMLFELVLHLPDENSLKFYIRDNHAYFSLKGIEYGSRDFDNIKNIICEQNCIEQIDNTIQKEVRDAMDKAKEYKARQNGTKMCSLEDQMICLSISSPYKKEEIYDMSIRTFKKMMDRIDYKLHYEMYSSAELSGMVKFKEGNPYKHWMNDLTPTDKFKDVTMDAEALHNKIDGVNA